jgi:uncharacterized protein (TIGR00106 family)
LTIQRDEPGGRARAGDANHHQRIINAKEIAMLVELSIVPVGGDAHLSDEIAEVLKIIDVSGLPYQLTPTGTCLEGEWEEVMSVVRQCHSRARERSPHVMTWIKIEDDEGETNKLTRNIVSVEEKAGRSLNKHPFVEDETLTEPIAQVSKKGR